MLFTIKTRNLNFKIGQNIKIVLKLKTKAINTKEINTTTFSFNTGKINIVVPFMSSQDSRTFMQWWTHQMN